jgi:large subunit ribosomal protein L25
MREMQELSAQPRAGTGKGPAYQTRQKGLIPAIVYGGEGAPEPVAVDAHALELHIEAGGFLTRLFMLEIAGKKTRVIPRQVQLDPVSDRPVHVDFMRLAEGASIALAIPVRFKGQGVSPGIKRGGVLNIVRHDVELYCPADNIPEYIEADLSEMDINDTLHISAFHLPEGVRSVIKRDFTVASIVAPTSVIEEQKAAAAAAAAAASAPVVEEAPVATGAPGGPGSAPPAAAAPAGAKAPAGKAPEKK